MSVNWHKQLPHPDMTVEVSRTYNTNNQCVSAYVLTWEYGYIVRDPSNMYNTLYLQHVNILYLQPATCKILFATSYIYNPQLPIFYSQHSIVTSCHIYNTLCLQQKIGAPSWYDRRSFKDIRVQHPVCEWVCVKVRVCVYCSRPVRYVQHTIFTTCQHPIFTTRNLQHSICNILYLQAAIFTMHHVCNRTCLQHMFDQV